MGCLGLCGRHARLPWLGVGTQPHCREQGLELLQWGGVGPRRAEGPSRGRPGSGWASLLLPHAWVEATGRPLCQMERLRFMQGMTLPRALGLATWWAGSRRGRAEAGRWPPWACSEPFTVCRAPGTPGPCWRAVCRVVGKMRGVLLAPGRAPLAQGWDCRGQWALTAPLPLTSGVRMPISRIPAVRTPLSSGASPRRLQ